jgi:peptide-methionine (R)-S-oxide reductase
MTDRNAPRGDSADRIEKPDDQWRAQLTQEQYQVTRCSATEPPFTGAYWDNKAEGMYHCICCNEPLFKSQAKFDSGTGWPSFYEPVADESVDTAIDDSHMRRRTEIVCRKCGAHLGHVFDDAPQTPTGLRYCVNSASLKFEEVDGE